MHESGNGTGHDFGGHHDHDHDHDHDEAGHFADRRPGSTDGPGPLSGLEKAVLRALLAGDDAGRSALRAQLELPLRRPAPTAAWAS